jgi:hypothetical protein
LDGTRIFQTRADQDNEQEVADLVANAWKCRVGRFGMLSAVDWYAERHGRLVGVLELKSRTHDAGKFKTVFLNVRKWLALNLASTGLGCPALFVVRFTDGVRWIQLTEVDATNHRIAGCSRLVKSKSDVEPVIEVDIAKMKSIS